MSGAAVMGKIGSMEKSSLFLLLLPRYPALPLFPLFPRQKLLQTSPSR
jgi:hypothetical protein